VTGRPAAAPEPTAAPEPAARPWDVWQLFFETTARLTTEIEARLKEHGCSLMDYQVLLLLRNADDHRLRMGELAQRLVFSPSRLSYQIGVLEKRGWVRRRRCAEDARGLEAELTEEGLRAFRRLRPAHARDVEELFLRALEGDDADRLAAVMDRLARRLA
jgi:DNA-binding MarR family transcriptional regulator